MPTCRVRMRLPHISPTFSNKTNGQRQSLDAHSASRVRGERTLVCSEAASDLHAASFDYPSPFSHMPWRPAGLDLERWSNGVSSSHDQVAEWSPMVVASQYSMGCWEQPQTSGRQARVGNQVESQGMHDAMMNCGRRRAWSRWHAGDRQKLRKIQDTDDMDMGDTIILHVDVAVPHAGSHNRSSTACRSSSVAPVVALGCLGIS
ncbi:hypothetical protein QBC47DRAFT_206501 [Echria macrotheca]|uniref:Uncharacterized protein n=1 Tax=Echria macrotheca TaxID=438768 RepID=A0AAJ0FB62_9PEZI|nr:hypothetical protein QBC47DRAFT_206501 [Echria macrotheca]